MRFGAVLVLLHQGLAGPTFPVIERPHTLTNHPGQVALPGGALERSDLDLWQAALRETREELGIATNDVVAVGRLEPVPVTPSRFLIVPFVGWLDKTPRWLPNEAEVARVADIPLDAILDTASVHEEERDLRGNRYVVTFYRVGDTEIWGATARVLSELADHLGAPARAFPPGWVRDAGS